MTTTPHEHDRSFDVDQMRYELNEQRIIEFLDTLNNSEDISAQLYNLTSVATKALERMLMVERQMMKEFITEATAEDGICPGCLVIHTRDVTNLENTINQFQNYLQSDGQCNG